MFIKSAILISILIQVVAAILAINLTRDAKYNKSWILLTMALLFMAARRVIEFFPFMYKDVSREVAMINSWIGVATSIIITIAIIYIRKIFRMIKMAEATKLVLDRKILRTIIRTEENERKRFAKDLHDGLGPLLSNVKMSISALEISEKIPDNLEVLSNMKILINEAISSIKEISNNLSPHILDNFGLTIALQSFSDKIKKTGLIDIQLITNIHNIRFNYNIEIILYRVICELINNTVKHAHAGNISIQIMKKDKLLNVIYEDDGVGFEIDENIGSTSGMGFSNMISRLNSINGKIVFKNKKNNGFKAVISCPVK
ncbi:MAG: sensor histidine kinase [Bacteroidales bacterium]|nr:sensor histidine kinase [Bacteroidales bacterium]